MNDNLDHGDRHLRPRDSDSRRVSRRELVGSAAALSWLCATGLPTRASATAGGTPANVRVSHDHYASHTEPCLAVNPRNPRNLLAACELPQTVATYVSFDGGRSWRSNGPLPLPADSPGGGNMSAAFDDAGRAFVCGLLLSNSGQRSTYVWRSDDGGRTFTAPLKLGSGPGLDRPWLATETRESQAVHVVWSNGSSSGVATALDYAHSTDGGRRFEAPRTIATVSAGLGTPVVACGSPGVVYALYCAGNGALESATDAPMTVNVICSRDGGQTFAAPIQLGHGQDLIAFPGLHIATTGSSPPARNTSLPAIAADPNTNLACVVYTAHHPGASHADIMLTISRNDGRTWTRATAVTPQDQVIYFEPQVAIDDTGRIGVMAFAMTHGMVSAVLIQSARGSSRFGPPIAVTDHPFNVRMVAGQNGNLHLGNYQALATTPGTFRPLWNDARTGKLQLYTAAVPS
jgi:hypothetical protein